MLHRHAVFDGLHGRINNRVEMLTARVHAWLDSMYTGTLGAEVVQHEH